MQNLSASFLAHLESQLSELRSEKVSIHQIRRVSGGSINESFHLKSNRTSFFLKVNRASKLPGLFEKEVKGLNTLKEASSLKVPQPLLNGFYREYCYLMMEYISSERSEGEEFWTSFGKGLAELHKNTQATFGLDYDNYIGSLVQKNSKCKNWSDFFIESRLQFQEQLALDQGMIDSSIQLLLSKLYSKIPDIFPDEPPALLHGDLWSGNFLAGSQKKAVIFDPAIYFGNREMDLAMTYLFGGFDGQFYHAYQSHYPLKDGWEKRIEICNLYPLLVHVNLFGSAYAQRLKSSLKHLINQDL